MSPAPLMKAAGRVPKPLLMAGAGLVLASLTRNPFLFLLPFPTFRAIERAIAAGRTRRARARREEQMLDFIDSITQSLRCGLSLRQALEASVEDVGAELREYIEPVLRELRVGKGVDESLHTVAESCVSPSLRLTFLVLGLIHSKGGDLPRLLERLRRRVSEGLEARREMRALTSQSRASGYLVSALPVVFLSLQAALNPSSLRPLFATSLGNLVLAVALALNAAAFLVIRRLVDTEA